MERVTTPAPARRKRPRTRAIGFRPPAPPVCPQTVSPAAPAETHGFELESLGYLLSLRESLIEKGYGPDSEQTRRLDVLLSLARAEGLL